MNCVFRIMKELYCFAGVNMSLYYCYYVDVYELIYVHLNCLYKVSLAVDKLGTILCSPSAIFLSRKQKSICSKLNVVY